jgi:hypothetical protein
MIPSPIDPMELIPSEPTSPSVSFVELARRLSVQSASYNHYCPCCGRPRDHSLEQEGIWEHYRCQVCHMHKSIRMR